MAASPSDFLLNSGSAWHLSSGTAGFSFLASSMALFLWFPLSHHQLKAFVCPDFTGVQEVGMERNYMLASTVHTLKSRSLTSIRLGPFLPGIQHPITWLGPFCPSLISSPLLSPAFPLSYLLLKLHILLLGSVKQFPFPPSF